MNKSYAIHLGIAIISGVIACLIFDIATKQTSPETQQQLITTAGSLGAFSALFIIFSAGQGVFPNNIRARSFLNLLLLILSFKIITTFVIGGTGSLLTALSVTSVDETVDTVPKTVDQAVKILTIAKKVLILERIRFKGYIEIAYVILLSGLVACLYKLLRSFGWGLVICIVLTITSSICIYKSWPSIMQERNVAIASIVIPALTGVALIIKNWDTPMEQTKQQK